MEDYQKEFIDALMSPLPKTRGKYLRIKPIKDKATNNRKTINTDQWAFGSKKSK
jgi:hypothetical protein